MANHRIMAFELKAMIIKAAVLLKLSVIFFCLINSSIYGMGMCSIWSFPSINICKKGRNAAMPIASHSPDKIRRQMTRIVD
jgi:hypothetical protein